MAQKLLGGFTVLIATLIPAGLLLNAPTVYLAFVVLSLIITATLLILLSRSDLSTKSQTINQLHQQLDQTQNHLEQVTDITDIKIKQQTYRLSVQKDILETIISGISDAIVVVNQNKQIIVFNKAASTLTGFEEKAVLGKSVDQVLKLYDKTIELTFMHYCPFRPAGFEGAIYQKNGLELLGRNKSTVNLITRQISENSPFAIGGILTFHDITNDKQFDSMKLDFVSMAAHELRTPLTSIKGYLSVFLSENKDKLNSDALKLLDGLNNASEQLSALVENLLSVTRIERGVLVVNLEAVDWVNFVKDLVTNFKPRAAAKEINLEFIPPAIPIPQIKVDKLRITEVLGNLISNAINYTDPGGKIKVQTIFEGQDVTTSVSDTGRGIPKEAQSQLFNKFFRVNSALGQGVKGTGLGLYISKSIIDIHHGKIWVTSELGKGATFSFSLPVG